MKAEIRAAIRKMKIGKAAGPDSISVALLEALEDYGTDNITTLLNEIFVLQINIYCTVKETRSNRV